MNINKLLFLSAVLALPVFAAEGTPGTTIANDSAKPPYGHHGAMSEACKADPEKCRKEMQAQRQAHREKMCAQNPEKCKEMKAQMEQRRAQCQADPAKCAQERQARMDERFRKADADGNGLLSRTEAGKGMPMLARHFDIIDTNKDGQVSRVELTTARKARHDAGPQHKM